MDIDSDISTVLASLRLENEANGEVVNFLYQFEDYYERKLWHQLTLSLEQFFYYTPEVTPQLKQKVFELFVLQFAKYLNPMKVVDFALGTYSDNPSKAVETLDGLRQNVEKEIRYANFKLNVGSEEEKVQAEKEVSLIIKANDAINYIDLNRARYLLQRGEIAEVEDILDKLATRYEIGSLGHVAVVDTITYGGKTAVSEPNQKVAAAYYYTKYEFFKLKKDFNQTYRSGLLYLSLVDASTLTHDQKLSLCYDLAMSALLGDKIYNFGELILHEILTLIQGNHYQWLYDLVWSLNEGDKTSFLPQLATAFGKLPELKLAEQFLVQKVTIMSLMELISQKAVISNKILLFDEIANATAIDIDQVELLVMKCFSLDLIRGTIDQAQQQLYVTWLQPRVLNLNQVKVLYNHLVNWDTQVDKLAKDVYKNGGAIWAEN